MSRPIDPRLPREVPALRRLLAALAVLQVLGALLTVAQAGVLAGLVVSIVLGGGHGSSLVRSLVLLAGVGAGRAAVAAAQEWLTARASRRVRAGLRRSVLSAVVRLGPGWASRQSAGRLVTAAGPGLEALDGYLTRAVPALVAAGVVPVIVLARIGLADWQSALLLVVTLPLVPVFMALVGVTTSRRMAVQYATLARLAGHFLDLVQGLTTLKVYGQAGRQVETVRRATDAYRRQTMHTLRFAFLSGLVLDLIATLSVAVVAVDVGLRLDHGQTDLRTALVVLLLAPELFAPLRAVGAQHHANEEGRVAAAAALDILDEAAAVPAVESAALRGRPGLPDGSIRIRGLVVSYPGRPLAALRGLDLAVAPGEVVAVQGESGGGKSTLLAVLLGFVAPAGGQVAVGTTRGEADLAALDPVGWRAGTAWAPQLPHPTQDTVAAEVLLGDPRATRAQVLAAITDCRAPHPDTPLGEDGARVSAGQRRRVGLARALLRARAVRAAGGVPIVALDEPSEDLDADTEQVVAAVIGQLAGWATVLMVTHSPRLARVADRRVEIADGRVAADVEQRRLLVRATRAADPGPVPRRTAPPAAPRRAPLRTLLGGAPETVGGLRRPDRRVRPRHGPLRIASRRLLSAALLSGATGLAGLALTASSVWLICRAAQHPNVQALAVAVVGVRTFALARALLRYAERLVGHDGALRLLADVRARVFAALVPLAPAGLAELRRGDLLRRFVSDVDGAQEGLVRAVVPLTGAALTAAGAITVAAVAAPAAGALLGAGLVVGLLLVPAVARRVAGDAGGLAAAAGLRDERTSAFLDGVAELAAYGADTAAVAAVADADAIVVRAARRPALAAAAGAGLGGISAAVTMALVLAAGAAAAAAGTLSPVTVGVLAACVLAGFDALSPLPAAFAAWSGFRAGLDRVAALLATTPPLAEPAVPAPVPAPVMAGVMAGVMAVAGPLVSGGPGLSAAQWARHDVGLDVGAVTLAPAARAPAVLTGATLVLHPGERIAVMGPSGCGKSTFLTAALRLLPVRAGRLDLVAGGRTVALADVAAADVPPLVAGSLQGDHVFRASLRDNLRVVRPAASDAELDVVAARAGLAGFVHEVAGGWSAPAGADGGELSGGERQRLLLARALLADPAVLVLDEPTAHLDPVTERAVLADLLAGTRGRTLLMSTHRELPEGSVDALVHVRRGSLYGDGRPVAVLSTVAPGTA